MKKNTFILLLVLSILFSLCACTPPRGELTVTSPEVIEETGVTAKPENELDTIQASPAATKETQEQEPTPEPESVQTKNDDSGLTKELDTSLDEVDALLDEIDQILAMELE